MAPEPILSASHQAVLDARGGDPVRGLRVASDAYRRARSEGSPAARLIALNAVAICQGGVGAHINSLGSAMDAYRLAVELEDRPGALHAMLSFIVAAIQIFEDTGSQFFDAIWRCRDEAASLADASLEARAENSLAMAQLENGELVAGREAYLRALELLPRTDGTTPEVLLLGNLANVAVRFAKTAPPEDRDRLAAEAHEKIAIALEKARTVRAVSAELRAHGNRGWLLQFEGRYEEALESYRRALEISSRIRHHTHVAELNRQIGATFASMSRDADAIIAFQAAEDVAGDIRPAQVLREVWNLHADAHDRMGNARGAARARAHATEESAIYERERAHARGELERFLRETGPI